eukprot:2148509-Pleurochrysis_carterae.AAC.3
MLSLCLPCSARSRCVSRHATPSCCVHAIAMATATVCASPTASGACAGQSSTSSCARGAACRLVAATRCLLLCCAACSCVST